MADLVSDRDLSLVVPAYNEAGRIRGTLEAMRTHLAARGLDHEVIVAADGDDATRDIVAEMSRADGRLSVFGSPERRGKGRGVRLGVARARGRIVGFVDADDKTPIEEMDKMLPWLERGYDLVIGSRGLADSRVEVPQPLYRQVGSRAFGLVMHLLLGLRNVRDTQCGFKFFRGDVARDLFARQRIDGYMFDVEILHLANRSGYRIKEVGVRWRDDRDSRLDLLAGNWRNLVDLLRIRVARYPAASAGRPAEAPAVLASGEKP
jgi:glycosyltransferase involved in cell wall biosynthesis